MIDPTTIFIGDVIEAGTKRGRSDGWKWAENTATQADCLQFHVDFYERHSGQPDDEERLADDPNGLLVWLMKQFPEWLKPMTPVHESLKDAELAAWALGFEHGAAHYWHKFGDKPAWEWLPERNGSP